MDLSTILSLSGGGVLLLISMFIKIPKVEVNVWAWIARKIGNEMNHDMRKAIDENNAKLDSLSKRLDSHEDRDAQREAKRCRMQIVEFGDKLLEGKVRSKDHFDTIILVCEEYERYCKEHPDFRNGVTTDTIKVIHEEYIRLWRDHAFSD